MAAVAGVSIATVSRVVNGDRRVGQEAREAVHRAIRELGYRPNFFARGLRAARTRVIAVLFPDLGNIGASGFIAPLESYIRRRGYVPIFTTSYSDLTFERRSLERLDQQVDGIIWFPVQFPQSFENLPQIITPIVVNGMSVRGIRSVGIDIYGLLDDAVGRFAAVGARAISYIHSRNVAGPGAWRDSFRAACERHGVTMAEPFCMTPRGPLDCAETMSTLLQEHDPPDAMLVSSFFVPAVYFALNRAGIRIPDDVSIISTGDDEYLRFLSPPPDVFEFDYQGRAQLLVDLLLDVIDGRADDEVALIQPYTFRPGASTRAKTR